MVKPGDGELQGNESYTRLLAEREAIEEPCVPSRYKVFKRLVTNPDNWFAVSFGGGSVPGMAGNCALARMLEELDCKSHVDEAWGTSAGSIVGGLWASGVDAASILARVMAMDSRKALDVPRWDFLVKGLWRFLTSRKVPDGLVRGDEFRRTIQEMLPVKTFEETTVPYRIVACTDDGQARKVVFQSGPLLEAMMASMCIPGILYPVEAWDGSEGGYFDGGVVEKTPLISVMEEHVRTGRESKLFIVCTHYTSLSRKHRPEGFVERFMNTISQLEETVWEYQRLRLRDHPDAKAVVVNPHFELGGMFDFEWAEFNYLWARRAYKEQLSNAKLSMRFDAR